MGAQLPEHLKNKVVVFIDGQNFFHSAKEAFGYAYPNYNPLVLSEKICSHKKWVLDSVRFYTGVPDLRDKPFWHEFWEKKLLVMGKKGIKTFKRSLRYRNQTIVLPDGKMATALVGQEKGIDIRIALDMVRMTHQKVYDIALIFSQDQDLTEAVEEVKTIAKEQKRWIKVASAFPVSPTYNNTRGIDKTDWLFIDRALYDSCIDPNDYRPSGVR
jgi:uncharacterized LabA/DUF88 family protein